MQTTLGEEIANSITHGIGAALSVAGLVVMLVSAAHRGTAWQVVAAAVYGVTLVLLYFASTLYHALANDRAKRVFRILDHSSIYLLIAGTYTPFALVTLPGVWGWPLLGLIWALAVAGIVLKCCCLKTSHISLSTGLYVAMGWLALAVMRPLARALDLPGLLLVVAGGALYTLGVIFFVWRRRYAHAVWHVFVLGGSLCHFCAVYWYVLPGRL